MTDQTYTIELTAAQAEDLFDAINVASLHYDEKFIAARHTVGSYDWRISSVDAMAAYEARRDLFTKRWVEFYQKVKLIRVAEKGGAA